METIASFQVDHTNLQPGIYISRQDSMYDTCITTYDIRMTAPNHEPAVNCAALHTIEHLVATYLRNLGRKSLEEVKKKLEDLGLSLAENNE